MIEAVLSQDPRWQTVEHILQSPSFRKAPRLSQLLCYLTEHTLLNEKDRLTEAAIALHVFGRNDSFDPAIDTVVRAQMMRLRQKLEQRAVEAHQAAEHFRVVIPKGEYLVRFDVVDKAYHSAPDLPRLEEPTQIPTISIPDLSLQEELRSPFSHKLRTTEQWLIWRPLVLLTAMALVAIGGFVGGVRFGRRPEARKSSSNNPLWDTMFQPNQKTIYIAPDTGLVLLHRLTRNNSTPLSEYLHRDFRNEMRNLPEDKVADALEIADRRYTSAIDIKSVAHFSRLAIGNQSTLVPLFARDVRLDDLKQENIILCGARYSNPWHELFEPELNFVGSMDMTNHAYSFLNKHPNPGEPASYTAPWTGGEMLGYIALVPGVNGKGNVLMIEGSSVGGGEAAADFLFNDAQLTSFLSKLQRRDGTLPYFEVLLKSSSINGNAGPLQILAYRIHS